MKMYRTQSYGCEIKKIEVEKRTEKSVWVKGSRSAIMSSWSQHFNTFDEAKSYLLKNAKQSIDSKKFQLECAESFLKNVEAQEE